MKLSVFSDRAYLPDGGKHVTLLYPFWGKNPEDPGDPSTGRYDRYLQAGHRFFDMSALERSDIAVFPADWSHVMGDARLVKHAEAFFDNARAHGKPVVVFFWNDSDADIPYDDTVVFRTSLYRSRQRQREFAMPSWSEDFVERYLGGELAVRSKRERPIVGFCGYAPASAAPPKQWRARLKRAVRGGVKRFLNQLDLRPVDGAIRTTAMHALDACGHIDTNFVVREAFLGGAWHPSGEVDVGKMHVVRREYVQNMVGSDYVLCARGAGNFSYRLYETLSCGRIPVFIDTDCVLPCQSGINWKDYCVWIDEKQVHRAGEQVAEFHASLSDRQFHDLQRACRRLWETHLSPEGFFSQFGAHF